MRQIQRVPFFSMLKDNKNEAFLVIIPGFLFRKLIVRNSSVPFRLVSIHEGVGFYSCY